MKRILVINPNSSQSVTDTMDLALNPIREITRAKICSMTMSEGPPAIESQADVNSVINPLVNLIRSTNADAFVIACFSDPGLSVARESTSKPVIGIGESAFLAAPGLGIKFGVISILSDAIPRHIRVVRSLGLDNRLAGDIAIESGVLGLEDEIRILPRMVSVAIQLREQHGAGVIILGCAGMGKYRHTIEKEVGLPVIDPVQVGVMRAITNLALRFGPI